MSLKALSLLIFASVLGLAHAQEWKASVDCKDAVPLPSATWGSTGAVDLKTAIFLDTGGFPAAVICPGITYNLNVRFPESRRYIVSTSQGNLSEPTAGCLNRVVSSTASTIVSQKLTLPCTATGFNYIRVASVSSSSSSTLKYKSLQLPFMISPVDVCVTSPCAKTGLTVKKVVDSFATAQSFPDAIQNVQQTLTSGLQNLGGEFITNLVEPLDLSDELQAFTGVLQLIRSSVDGSGSVTTPSQFLTGMQQLVNLVVPKSTTASSGLPGLLGALTTIGSATGSSSTSATSGTGFLTALQTVSKLFNPSSSTTTVTVQSVIQSGQDVLNSLVALMPQSGEPVLSLSDLPALIVLVRSVGGLFNQLGQVA